MNLRNHKFVEIIYFEEDDGRTHASLYGFENKKKALQRYKNDIKYINSKEAVVRLYSIEQLRKMLLIQDNTKKINIKENEGNE